MTFIERINKSAVDTGDGSPKIIGSDLVILEFKEFIKRLKDDKMFKQIGGELAIWLHTTYEMLSSLEGWKTQEKCKVEFKSLPKENQRVMLRLAQEIQLKYFTEFLLKIDELAGNKLI